MRAKVTEMFTLLLYEAMGKVFQDEISDYRIKMHARIYATLISKKAFSVRGDCVG